MAIATIVDKMTSSSPLTPHTLYGGQWRY